MQNGNTKYSQFGSASHNDRRFRPETPKAKRPIRFIGFEDDFEEPIQFEPVPATFDLADEIAMVDAMVDEYDSRDFSGFEGVRF